MIQSKHNKTMKANVSDELVLKVVYHKTAERILFFLIFFFCLFYMGLQGKTIGCEGRSKKEGRVRD